MPPRKFKLLAFDFDGTLVDTQEDIAEGVNRVRADLGCTPLPLPVIRTFIGRGVVHLMDRAIQDSDSRDVEGAVLKFRKYYGDHLVEKTCYYPECLDILEFFPSHTKAILSNKPVDFILRILEVLGGKQHFDSILGGDSVKNKKPDPEGALHLLNTHQIEKEDMLFIGDSPIDIETGKNAGVATCAVTWGLNPLEGLRAAQPDFMIDSMSELKSRVC